MQEKVKSIFPADINFGLGGVALGNEFAYVTDEDAYETLEAAWNAGVRYFDTAPWYGLGLSERRFGNFLHNKKRSDYIISSKVGKLLKASPNNNAKEYFPFTSSPNNLTYDYSADGVRRSIEDSLQRMGVDSLDIVFVHDISSDNKWLPGTWQEQFEIARKGAFPELTKMREEGMIKGWGLGVNTPEPILKLMEVADANICLLARQYSLIDHAFTIDRVFPAAKEKGMAFVAATALNAGFLAGRPRYNYGDKNHIIPPEIIAKREKLQAVVNRYGVDLRTAAIQFTATPAYNVALLVGASSEKQILEDYTSMQVKIPPDFWAELKTQKLLAENAPVPA